MKKSMLLVLFLFIGLGASRLQAQSMSQPPSLKNTNWKAFFDQLGDTLTLHIRMDSSFVTTKSGDVVVRSLCKIKGDTIIITDYDGQYACPNQDGRYKINVKDDVLVMALIDDACDGRGNNLNNLKWMKAPADK